MFFIFNAWELFSEKKRLTSLNVSGTYQGEPSLRLPSCTTPLQPTIYEWPKNIPGSALTSLSSSENVVAPSASANRMFLPRATRTPRRTAPPLPKFLTKVRTRNRSLPNFVVHSLKLEKAKFYRLHQTQKCFDLTKSRNNSDASLLTQET